MESRSAREEDGGANFPAPWPFMSFLRTLPWPLAQDPLSEGLLHSLSLPLSPIATVGKDITEHKGRVWRGLEKEAPSPLVKLGGDRRGGRGEEGEQVLQVGTCSFPKTRALRWQRLYSLGCAWLHQ